MIYRSVSDTISRQALIDILEDRIKKVRNRYGLFSSEAGICSGVIRLIREQPPAQPTLYGYNIKHLAMIAMVLQKEDLPPERVAEALNNIGRIVAVVKNEFEEALRKAVEE